MTPTEDQLVAWLQEHSSPALGRCLIGIGDDMAQIRWDEADSLCFTTDLLLEGVHFDLTQASLEQVGYKAMAVNLSDCAAMGTIPVAAVVSVSLPTNFGIEEIQQLHQGLLRAGEAFACTLVGGDTTRWHRSGPLTVNVAMISRPAPGKGPVTRQGARVGDVIAVTGRLGGSLTGHHLDFTPRVSEALELMKLVDIHAMMDLSDGLSLDLNRLCRASAVGAVVRRDWIPLTAAAQETPDPLRAALNDGEDFELLFTVDPGDWKRLVTSWDNAAPPLTQIGVIRSGDTIGLCDEAGHEEPLEPRGYDHLGRE